MSEIKYCTHTIGQGLQVWGANCPYCQIDKLTASLAEAREQLKKYEGCVEVEGKITLTGKICVSHNNDSLDVFEVNQPVTVWVRKRREG